MSNWWKLHVSKWQHAEWTCVIRWGKLELVLNEGSDLEDFLDSGSEENTVGDFLDSGSEENIVDSGEEFVPVDLKADLRDSDNNIFIFIIGICATSRIKNNNLLLCLDSSRFAVGTEKGIWYDAMVY